MPTMRPATALVMGLAAFSGMADAFWRLPCRGRSGLARVDPLMDPGKPSYHVHAVHGSSAFGMTADTETLRAGQCTSCGVKQDKSAYWAPALYFMHENGEAEIVEEVGGMLAYYLLYGDNVEAFPDGFRMIAGDPFLRDFPWPVPDPPKSEWSGEQASQKALAQKAIGFNCLNYAKTPEPSLGRHFLPNKTYLDEHCTDGVRFELMFPSCWNGKDVDTEDHKSHVRYPSLVMDGTCPEGFEHRIVSLFFETIWDTYAFKDKEGYFVLSQGDPTGYGYHGDFMHGWEPGVLEQAVKQCTNPSGEVSDCPIFELQSEAEQLLCKFDVPEILKSEEVEKCTGIPNGLSIEWGPNYAYPISYTTAAAPSPTTSKDSGFSLDLGGILDGLHINKASSTTTTSSSSTSTWTPTPTTSYVQGAVTQAVVYVEREVVVLVDGQGKVLGTQTGDLETVSTSYSTTTEVVSTIVSTPTDPPAKRHHAHKRHGHGHAHAH
ncbi:WSC-domain-containing protein [Aspergillus terreus]|uniref:WSC-domain-containing protein n=1 Tax=Aspergillus terreus TaxID=33178 RepID=A0A5M3YNX7_ASPTE|nr:hypothetical protein ATETN484_0002025100 [Aspergillus terreus]GFF15107.1 WSC-domain-containing protein [Aspergillus terreus]